MVKKKLSMQAKSRLVVLAPISLFCILAFLSSVISYGYEIYHLQQEKSSLDSRYTGLQEVADELKIEITKLQDPEYIAKFAREQYMYSKDGELIIRINETKKTEASITEVEKADKMVAIGSIGAVGLILVYIVIRSTKKRNQE